VLQLWFALDNGFSGQILFDKWCIGIYNVVSLLSLNEELLSRMKAHRHTEVIGLIDFIDSIIINN